MMSRMIDRLFSTSGGEHIQDFRRHGLQRIDTVYAGLVHCNDKQNSDALTNMTSDYYLMQAVQHYQRRLEQNGSKGTTNILVPSEAFAVSRAALTNNSRRIVFIQSSGLSLSRENHFCNSSSLSSQGGAVIKPAEGGGVAEDSLSFSLSLSPRLALFFCLFLYFIKVKRQRLKRPRANSVFLSFSFSPSRSLYLSLSLFHFREKVTPEKAKSIRECSCP